MKREIKFRYRFTNGESWIMTTYSLDQIINGDPYEGMSNNPFLKKYKHVGEDQFTGLRDKNGVQIYEGDIMRLGEKEVDVVEFRDCMFCFKNIVNQVWLAGIHTHYPVIGNIYQNPELLAS